MTLSARRRAIPRLFFVLCFLALGLAAPSSLAQADKTAADAAYVPTLTFDVVSIRESKVDMRGYIMRDSNSPHDSLISAENYRAVDLIAMAYDIDSRNISGGPDWTSSIRFYMKAKSDSSVDDILAKLTDKQGWKEKQHMLQVMLADRFQLKLHRVTRDATVYDLVVAKGGSKLRESKPVPKTEKEGTDSTSEPIVSQRCDQKGCEIDATRCPLKDLADMLGGQVTTYATDRTGLTGVYDFTLRWGSESFSGAADENLYPPVFTAVKEQLGLELKPVKGTIDAIVIDHIEKPSEN